MCECVFVRAQPTSLHSTNTLVKYMSNTYIPMLAFQYRSCNSRAAPVKEEEEEEGQYIWCASVCE